MSKRMYMPHWVCRFAAILLVGFILFTWTLAIRQIAKANNARKVTLAAGQSVNNTAALQQEQAKAAWSSVVTLTTTAISCVFLVWQRKNQAPELSYSSTFFLGQDTTEGLHAFFNDKRLFSRAIPYDSDALFKWLGELGMKGRSVHACKRVYNDNTLIHCVPSSSNTGVPLPIKRVDHKLVVGFKAKTNVDAISISKVEVCYKDDSIGKKTSRNPNKAIIGIDLDVGDVLYLYTSELYQKDEYKLCFDDNAPDEFTDYYRLSRYHWMKIHFTLYSGCVKRKYIATYSITSGPMCSIEPADSLHFHN